MQANASIRPRRKCGCNDMRRFKATNRISNGIFTVGAAIGVAVSDGPAVASENIWSPVQSALGFSVRGREMIEFQAPVCGVLPKAMTWSAHSRRIDPRQRV